MTQKLVKVLIFFGVIVYKVVMNSIFEKLFGTSKSNDKAPTPQEAIEKLRAIEEMLIKKSEFLERKIQTELENAKKQGKANKRGEILGGFSFVFLPLEKVNIKKLYFKILIFFLLLFFTV